MRKKSEILCVILVICMICIYCYRQNPKIVNCITTMDTAYLTVVMRGSWFAEKEETAWKIIDMCENNGFEDIKFSIKSRENLAAFYVTVYKTTYQMDRGKQWMIIRYNRIEKAMKVL